jgi:hypothetical protein
MTARTLRRLLARDFPLSARVVVSFEECQEPGTMGECWMEDGAIRINIGPASNDEQCWTLCHEWAHAIHFAKLGKQCGRHSVQWAKYFAKLAQRYFPE